MLFNIIPVIIFFVCLGIIVAVVLKRLPDIASIKVDSIPEAKAAATKQQILVDRLKRKAVVAAKAAWAGTSTQRQTLKQKMSQAGSRLRELEKTYRQKNEMKKAEPKTVDEMIQRAERLRASEQYPDAEKIYLEVIRIDHRNAEAYKGLGLLYQAREDYAEARQALEYAARLKKDDPKVFAAIGQVAVEEARYADARRAYTEAIVLEPEVLEHHIAMGDVAMIEKDYASAAAAFVGAVALVPLNPRCLDRLLEASILNEDKKLAVETLRKLTEVNPENQKLVEFRQRVAGLSAHSKRKGV